MMVPCWNSKCLPRAFAVLTAAVLSACGDHLTTPTPEVPPAPNAAPVIQSLTASSNRAEVSVEIELTAVVQDQETNPASLMYDWSAAGGSFSGTGASVRWRAPAASVPASFDLTLTVVERYTSGTEVRENRTTATTIVHVNDSPREVTNLALTFLGDFVHSELLPEVCVRNFSGSCPGKQAELSDVQNDRNLFIHSPTLSSFSIRSITYDTANNQPAQATFITVLAPCSFATRDKAKPNAEFGYVVGTCRLTNVYENWQWYLCDSNFDPSRSTTFSLFRF